MPPAPRRLLVRAIAAGLALGAAVAAGSLPAAAVGCAGGTGVTVVVDDGHASSTECAPGDPTSGLGALRAAGHGVTMVEQFPGAVCRIDGTPADDPCLGMPPQDAYWSYWRATPGGTWTYSNVGPASTDPGVGSVEGWAFGDGSPPKAPPPSAGGADRAAGSDEPATPAGDGSADSSAPARGSATGLVVGTALIVLLGGGAGWVVRRRRDRGDER